MADTEEVAAEGVRGVLHCPVGAPAGGLVLAHGAGSDRDAPILVAAAAVFSAAGWLVLRIDLPFRQRRPKGPPPRGAGPDDRLGLSRAIATLRQRFGGALALGGHSYGGRQATLLAAEDAAVADALLLFSYPLHPPTAPDRLRVEHFPRLRIPAVFVQGERDAFGGPDELAAALAVVPAPTMLLPVAGAGHDLKRGRIDFAPALAAVLSLLPPSNP